MDYASGGGVGPTAVSFLIPKSNVLINCGLESLTRCTHLSNALAHIDVRPIYLTSIPLHYVYL